jgi:signal transduction histidine kinase/CheY-like chemotaxis protein
MSMGRLRSRVLILAAIAAVLSALVLGSGLAWMASRSPVWIEVGAVLLAALLVFLCGGFLRVWHLARLHLQELEDALVQLREARVVADEANRAKSRFLATVSHELRTPLNGVLGMTGLLLDTPLTEAQKSYADAVDTSARSLLSIIDELLDAAHNDSGELTISTAPAHLPDLIESVMELMSSRAHAKGIEVGCTLSPDLPDHVVTDAKRLRQILLNLVGNAIKFTSEGGVLVAMSAAETPDLVRIEVRDSGVGIPADELEKVFDRFAHSSLPQARAAGGTGLGLSITRQLVNLMGGKIRVESIVGTGSSFIVELPMPRATSISNCEKPFATSGSAGSQFVLAMPNGVSQEVFAHYLEAMGANVRKVTDFSSLDAAIEDCEKGNKPKLLLDVSLVSPPAEAHTHALRYIESTSQVWVILRPEDRRFYRDLINDERLSYLLKPARRATLAQQLGSSDCPAARWAKGLRQTAERMRAGEEKAGLRVLLVEDNHINMLLATKILGSAGHSVCHAASGESAVDEIRRELADNGTTGFDVVLMDVHMPGIDGFETTRQIRALEMAAGTPERLPILALSANSSADDKAEGAKAGMNGYLSKPFDRADLESAIARLARASNAA